MSQAKKKRIRYGLEPKAKAGQEAVHGVKTINEIVEEYGVHPVLDGQWKKEIRAYAEALFEGKRGLKPQETHDSQDRLYGEVGRLKMELDWLKKIRVMSVEEKMAWIEQGGAIVLSRQCELACVSRASVYRQTIEREHDEEDVLLCRLIDKEYSRQAIEAGSHVGHASRDPDACARRQAHHARRLWKIVASISASALSWMRTIASAMTISIVADAVPATAVLMTHPISPPQARLQAQPAEASSLPAAHRQTDLHAIGDAI